jgi:hypothetical protein
LKKEIDSSKKELPNYSDMFHTPNKKQGGLNRALDFSTPLPSKSIA